MGFPDIARVFFWVDYSCEENGRPEADGMGFPGNQPRLASYRKTIGRSPTHASVEKKKKKVRWDAFATLCQDHIIKLF